MSKIKSTYFSNAILFFLLFKLRFLLVIFPFFSGVTIDVLPLYRWWLLRSLLLFWKISYHIPKFLHIASCSAISYHFHHFACPPVLQYFSWMRGFLCETGCFLWGHNVCRLAELLQLAKLDGRSTKRHLSETKLNLIYITTL